MSSIRPRSVRTRVAAGVLGTVLLIAWWWPGISGQDQQTDVIIMPNASTMPSRDVIDRRLREQGFTTAWTAVPEDSCSVGDVPAEDFENLVVVLPTADCDVAAVRTDVLGIAESAGLSRTVVVLSWLDEQQNQQFVNSLRLEGVRIVDPRPLIGDSAEALNCLWWDDCPPEGRIVTVLNNRLTEAGHQRLARLIVAGVL